MRGVSVRQVQASQIKRRGQLTRFLRVSRGYTEQASSSQLDLPRPTSFTLRFGESEDPFAQSSIPSRKIDAAQCYNDRTSMSSWVRRNAFPSPM